MMLKPRLPPLPLSYMPHPDNWRLKSALNPGILCGDRPLRCLAVEIATTEEQALVVILDIKREGPGNYSMELFLENVRMAVKSQNADTSSGILYLWGILPYDAIHNESRITLRAVTGDSLCDVLDIGIFCMDVEPVYESASPFFINGSSEYKSNLPFEPSADSHDPLGEEYRRVLPSEYKRMQLNINGDLGSMTHNWTAEEQKVGRRLVRFERHRLGSVVELTFKMQPSKSLSEGEMMPDIISCVEWPQDRRGHFVTSFDILKLVEYILEISMNTEVKNRARRNMASIASQTLAKVGMELDSANDLDEDAFTIVMGFGDPKPRSIEKSIKVYDWHDLADCLSKILSRFATFEIDDSKDVAPFEHQLDAIKNWKRQSRATRRKQPKQQSSPREPMGRSARVTRAKTRSLHVQVPASIVDNAIPETPGLCSSDPGSGRSSPLTSQPASAISRQASSTSLSSSQDEQSLGNAEWPTKLSWTNADPKPLKTDWPPHSFHDSSISGDIISSSPVPASPVVARTPTVLGIPTSFEGNWAVYAPPCIDNVPAIRTTYEAYHPLVYPGPTDYPYLPRLSQMWTASPCVHPAAMQLDSPIEQESQTSPLDMGSDGVGSQDMMEEDYSEEIDQWLDTDYITTQEAKDTEAVQ